MKFGREWIRSGRITDEEEVKILEIKFGGEDDEKLYYPR